MILTAKPLRRSILLLLICLGFSLQTFLHAEVDDEKRLLDLALQKKRLFEIVVERPEFFTEAQLAERLEELSERFADYVADYPGDVMGLILWARLLQIMEREEAALRLFLKADDLDPDIAVVKQQIGNHLAESGEGIAALAYLFRAAELEPEEAIYHYQLGALLHHFQEMYMAEGILSRSDLDAAMQHAFREAARLLPESFDLQMRYGESYYDVEAPVWENALKHWQAMEAVEEEVFREQVIMLHIARVLTELNKKQQALEVLEDVRHSSLRKNRDELIKRIGEAASKGQ